MDINTHELAWAAGLVDGEGHIGFHLSQSKGRTRKYGVISLNIAQKDRQVLDRFKQAVQRGKVYGPYTHGRGEGIRYFGYYSHNFQSTQAIIALIWKWLSPVKRAQARAVLLAHKVYVQRPRLPLGRRPRRANVAA